MVELDQTGYLLSSCKREAKAWVHQRLEFPAAGSLVGALSVFARGSPVLFLFRDIPRASVSRPFTRTNEHCGDRAAGWVVVKAHNHDSADMGSVPDTALTLCANVGKSLPLSMGTVVRGSSPGIPLGLCLRD
ncbi:unnamed protein product [Lepidochelys olivacea]